MFLAVLAALGAWVVVDQRSGPRAPGPASGGQPAGAARAPSEFRAELPERAPLQRAGKDPFSTRSWTPPPARRPAGPVAAAPPPVAPPLPYRYVGELVLPTGTQVYLARGDDTFRVSEGETLDGQYRVESIKRGEMVFVHLATGQQQTMRFSLPGEDAEAQARAIVRSADGAPRPAGAPAAVLPASSPTAPATASAGPAEPARLRWDGPASAKAGATFNVALRMTSASEQIRSAPMEVRFDPKLLEPVSVRPGRYFGADRSNFGYRISGEGSIYIGVSNRTPPSTANDAELLVLTFKPIKAGALAELNVAALNLQGTAGRPVAYTALGAFKTTIIP
ncbi:MAG TPA: cohesin domain-containing protein [Burkholderiales bacterium]